jgi:mRNA interferase RelE/StbE
MEPRPTPTRAYRVTFEPSAWKQIMALPLAVQERIFALTDALELEPRPSGVKKMQGSQTLYRGKAGNYRVVYEIEDTALLVLVVKVGDRKEVYKKR